MDDAAVQLLAAPSLRAWASDPRCVGSPSAVSATVSVGSVALLRGQRVRPCLQRFTARRRAAAALPPLSRGDDPSIRASPPREASLPALSNTPALCCGVFSGADTSSVCRTNASRRVALFIQGSTPLGHPASPSWLVGLAVTWPSSSSMSEDSAPTLGLSARKSLCSSHVMAGSFWPSWPVSSNTSSLSSPDGDAIPGE